MADETEAPKTGEGGATEDAAAEGAAAPNKKKKMMLIISIALAVLGIGVAVGVVFFMGGDSHEKKAEEAPVAEPLAIVEVPEFNLSLLSDDPGTPHFMKIKLSFELAKATDMPAATQAMPRLQDDWGGLLRQMRVNDLQGTANLQRLKEGLLRRAVQSFDPIEVKAVYIRELLVQ